MLGNQGSTKVEMVRGLDGLSFIEITSAGNVMTTAITSGLKSVHGRNSNFFGDLIAQQYYGTCKVK